MLSRNTLLVWPSDCCGIIRRISCVDEPFEPGHPKSFFESRKGKPWISKRGSILAGIIIPEQWDEETIRKDMELFKKAHVNLVVLPVFGWAKLEPEEGIYDFEWLTVSWICCGKNGIRRSAWRRRRRRSRPGCRRSIRRCYRWISKGVNGPTACGFSSAITARNIGRGPRP